jgi:hypothetical protein
MRASRVLDIAFGGLYASTSVETGKVSLFRLLDFNVDAVHVAMYGQKFDALPDAADVKALSPMIRHAPIDARTLLRDDELHLIAESPLSAGDLEGYATYLEAMGVSEDDRGEVVQQVIALSHKRGMRVRLRADGDTLVVEEP